MKKKRGRINRDMIKCMNKYCAYRKAGVYVTVFSKSSIAICNRMGWDELPF